ncbi:hypothetical protein Tco_1182968 [Tanacetum coccineum]
MIRAPMRLRELLLLAKMRSEFCLEIFVIEDTTCLLTVPPYSGRVFEGARSYLGLLSDHKNRYGKAFSVRLGENNPLSSAQKVLPNPQGLRQRLSGIFAGYVKPLWEGILLSAKVCGAFPSYRRWEGIPPIGRFPGRVCTGKLKCCPLTKLVVPDLRKWKSEKIAKVAHSRFFPLGKITVVILVRDRCPRGKGPLKNLFEQRIAAMMGYRGGSGG